MLDGYKSSFSRVSIGLATQMALFMGTLILAFAIFFTSLRDGPPLTVSEILFLALGFVLIALPFTLTFAERIVRPVRAMTTASQRVVDGDFSGALDVQRNDELGDLAAAFGTVTRHLAENVETVQRMSITDILTGAHNRDWLKHRIEFTLAADGACALLLLDIERLSRINEALGSDVGDQVIIRVAERLQEAATRVVAQQADDSSELAITITRLGGDEFGILMQGWVTEQKVAQLAQDFINTFSEPFQIGGHVFAVFGRIGIALAPADGSSFSTLLSHAEAGLHEAKTFGRTMFRQLRRDPSPRAYDRLIIEQELRRAISNNDLDVHYQPQVALSDGAIVGAEALVRWRHPKRGVLQPAEFIDLAEEAGLLNDIGLYVLRRVCAQAAAWQKAEITPKVSINVSASHCQHENFARMVLDTMVELGTRPEWFEIEITETVAMRDPVKTAHDLEPLRAAGVRLAIDDFGTGYSNLAALVSLPFDILKIDRAFISGCGREGSARVLVSTILSMARHLGFETIAEGVETDAQREFLMKQQCGFAQGYLFGRPVSADEFVRLYKARQRKDARQLLADVESRVRPAG